MSKRLIKLKEVETLTSLKKTAIYKRISDGTFPSQIGVGGNRVAWEEQEIQSWIDDRIKAARAQA